MTVSLIVSAFSGGLFYWIPAYAGTTSVCGNDGSGLRQYEDVHLTAKLMDWILVCASMTVFLIMSA